MKTFYTLCMLVFPYLSNAQNLQGKIIYSHHNSVVATNQDSIYVLDKNGTPKFLTLGFAPRVSQKGDYMAFQNQSSSFGANIWLRNLVTKKDTQLFAPGGDYLNYFDFSPSESQIVYGYFCAIYSVDIDGTNGNHQITGVPDCYSDEPQVRVSDSTIVYHNLNHGLYLSSYSGGTVAQIPNTVPGDLNPTWSSDGSLIAYEKSPTSNYLLNNIAIIRPDGSDSATLSSFALTDTVVNEPVFSRDMTEIYFIGRIKDTLGIYAVKTDKSGTYRRVYTFSSFGSASDYFLGVSDSLGALTLPITLINFNGRYWGKYVQLNWQTTQEVNSHKFDVERSLNGSLFVKIGTVAAKGNSNVTSNYRFVDNDLPFNAPQQVLFYRLKSIDKDGVYAYSDVLALDAAQNESVGIFPNPNNGTFRFTTREVNRKLSVLITDAAGRKIYENNFYNTSSPLVRIPPIKGIYFFRAEGDKEIFTKKLVVE